MKKITNFIVDKRKMILVIFVILSCFCLYLSSNVNINSDISKYLPKSSETKIGKEIMDKEFTEQKSSYLNVMFKNLNKKDKEKIYKKLSKINGVSSVEYDNSKEYNNGKYTLYKINVDDYSNSKTSKNIYNCVKDKFDIVGMNGSIYNEFKPVLKIWIVFVAIGMAMIILTLLSESYIEPWLYLISIGVAVFINKGTNIMFSSVSNITDSICAILQLALSMDYSIMLSNRYRQERKKEKNKEKAMKNALFDSFNSISSSSITTVVGLLALVFMSFTIGKDLGFVLAKGVVLSLISIFLFLPGLLLLFDKYIINSKKKSINFKMNKIGNFSYKTRYVQLILIILLFGGAFLLKGNLNIVYTGSEQDIVGKYFPNTNQIAIVYKNEYEKEITEYCKKIENDVKANQVLCYSNTINEKLAYNELNKKLKELGQDTEIDEYLIQIIYYNYYNKNQNNTMTLDEFINFIKKDIYTNNKISNSIDNSKKENINKLENFSNKQSVEEKKSLHDISNILGIKESKLEDIMLLYNSKNIDIKITLNEFINFMINEISKNPTYSSKIDKNTLNQLNKLKPYTNKKLINKKMNQQEISNLFSIDKNLVDQLFMFYRTTNNTNTSLKINEFSSYALKLQTNEKIKNMLDEETINNLKLLNTLSNEQIINNKLDSSSLSKLVNSIGINIDSNILDLLMFYNYLENNSTSTKLTLNTFTKEVLNDEKTNILLNNNIKTYLPILNTFTNKEIIISELNKDEMYTLLSSYGFNNEQIEHFYINISNNLQVPVQYVKLTPYKFLTIVKENLSITDSNYNNISLLLNIMDLSYNSTYNIEPLYDYETLTNYLQQINKDITKETISLGYKYYDYKKSDIANKTMSLKELVTFLITNQNNELIKEKLINKEQLELANLIVNNIDKKYTYKEISTILNEDEKLIKQIYNLVDYSTLETKLTPFEFVSLILNNKDNNMLKNKINKETLELLNLLNTVMNSTANNTLYNSNSLSKLFNSDKETVSLVLTLYNKNNLSNNISLIDLSNFIMTDVITNSKYSSNLDSNSIDKLKTINTIMNNTVNNVSYNTKELTYILNKLSNVDSNLIDLVYIYHGSKNNYDSNWKLTVEEIINYTNDVLLKDNKFKDFIDKDMKDKIKDAKIKISESKDLLVTKNYSRIIINSKYDLEGKDTYKFIENTKKELNKKGIYVIGDSPMALEMSKSFNRELDFITILTMIFIFVVVAFTFKNLLIPLILVLIIQCAVYVTMSILSITGVNVYFISILIVQAILMGATIDYAIVYTSYYKELRHKYCVKDAIIEAYNHSIHTILTSSSILIIVTLVVSLFADAIAAKICETISEGTFCSAILILFILPGILSIFDKFICKDVKKEK